MRRLYRAVHIQDWLDAPAADTIEGPTRIAAMSQPGYKQFCPVALAAELLCRRWTIVILRELIAGTTRFNDLRRGVPKMSPTLLSQRLRELEMARVIERRPVRSERGTFEYHLTDAGRDLAPIVEGMGHWGQRWIESRDQLENLDATLLMWDMRRNLRTEPLPPRRTVIQFVYHDLAAPRRMWWLVVEPQGGVDLCSVDPGFELDLCVTTDLRTMTAIWMGRTRVRDQLERIKFAGDRGVASRMQDWLGLSPFAHA